MKQTRSSAWSAFVDELNAEYAHQLDKLIDEAELRGIQPLRFQPYSGFAGGLALPRPEMVVGTSYRAGSNDWNFGQGTNSSIREEIAPGVCSHPAAESAWRTPTPAEWQECFRRAVEALRSVSKAEPAATPDQVRNTLLSNLAKYESAGYLETATGEELDEIARANGAPSR